MLVGTKAAPLGRALGVTESLLLEDGRERCERTNAEEEIGWESSGGFIQERTIEKWTRKEREDNIISDDVIEQKGSRIWSPRRMNKKRWGQTTPKEKKTEKKKRTSRPVQRPVTTSFFRRGDTYVIGEEGADCNLLFRMVHHVVRSTNFAQNGCHCKLINFVVSWGDDRLCFVYFNAPSSRWNSDQNTNVEPERSCPLLFPVHFYCQTKAQHNRQKLWDRGPTVDRTCFLGDHLNVSVESCIQLFNYHSSVHRTRISREGEGPSWFE